jgi:DNA-directed RNA polymerase subunit N
MIGHLWEQYQTRTEAGDEAAEVMNDLGLERYCCRRMFVSHLDLLHEVAPFSITREP